MAKKRKHNSPKGNNSKAQAVDMSQSADQTNQAVQAAHANTLAHLQHMFPPGFQPFTPTSPPFQPYQNTQEPQWAKNLMQKMESIERSMNFISEEFEKFRNNISNIQKDVIQIKEENKTLRNEIEIIKDQIIDNKSHSMRNNLLIYGFPEARGENCEETVRNFLKAKLDIDTSKIEIERSHRFGKFKHDKQRPIVSRFLRFKDKEAIKKNSFKLKGTNFGVSDQYPKEVNEKRTMLRTIEKEEKSKGTPTFLHIDKLFTPGWCHFVKNGKVQKTPSNRPVYPPRRPIHDEKSQASSRTSDPNISVSQVLTGANQVLHG